MSINKISKTTILLYLNFILPFVSMVMETGITFTELLLVIKNNRTSPGRNGKYFHHHISGIVEVFPVANWKCSVIFDN
ncbi:hypothetical protein L873DRAFT_1806068 [Choiromyces venosus 120613-1]|uniref:Uncharacterized protein n=1 Tax=Choiromyces venosus 120613-1 TaxID=1336337 RepID=A0A3N4JRK8_9PEZI|nr:hypothetical protein L873DRAFT_1806068 [Choiromyces venosus 120613-1]